MSLEDPQICQLRLHTKFYVFKKFVQTMESLKVRNLSRLLHRHKYCSDFVWTWYLTSNFWVRLVISYGSLSSLLLSTHCEAEALTFTISLDNYCCCYPRVEKFKHIKTYQGLCRPQITA